MSGKLHRSHRPELEELAKQQIDEPLYELKIAKTMPQLNPIKNDVSNAVRDQYEENPYPRWLNLDIYSQTKKQKEASRGKKILIGGCGTGRESINLATLFPNAEVLAVDLSLTSLAYGQRKAEEYGVKNIKYMHADILDLHMLDVKYDLIASAGVLHHMEEPRKGFEQFVNLLNPNGVLKIGVYSDLGRQAVIRCRDWIAENGWEPTTDNVRKFRTSILDLPDDDPLKEIATWKSFYSLSNCRDLVFHVQEHRFTMPKLEALFNDLSLELIGFILQNKSLRATYKELYPDDPHLVNFKNWHEYETKNPGTFSLMYNFWLGKKGEYVNGQYPEWVKIALGDAIY